MDLSYIINQLGEERERYFNAVVPPIMQSSIFAAPNIAGLRRMMADEMNHYLYTRGNNPTVDILAKKIAALEGAERALMFGSGAAAVAAGVMAFICTGDDILSVAKPYAWTKNLLQKELSKFGVSSRFIDAKNSQAVADAIQPNTRMLVLESPNSLTFEQQDLAAIATIARQRGVLTLIDNSYATPLNQSPIAMGIDMVAHSATKYINGHSDAVVGALCGSDALMQKVFRGPYMTFGAILSPHDAWLVIRGLRTLPARLKQIAETSMKVLGFLQQHKKVLQVYSPHAQSNPQFGLTQQQLRGASGLLSFELDTNEIAGVERFCDALKRFLISVSWGGYESQVLPTAGVREWDSIDAPAPVSIRLVRLSIGLEDAAVLIADLSQAFEQV